MPRKSKRRRRRRPIPSRLDRWLGRDLRLSQRKNEWIRRSRSGSRGPFYLAKASPEWRSLGGDPSAGSPTDTLFTCSPCRHGAWTVSSSDASCVGARRAVSEGSDRSIGLPCGLSAPAHFYVLANRVRIAGSSEFPAYSQVCSGSLRIRSRNTVYDLALLAEPRF